MLSNTQEVVPERTAERQNSCLESSPPQKSIFNGLGKIVERRRQWVLLLIILAGFGVRLAGLVWGQSYCYFAQGDGIEAYSVAVNYANGEARAQYLGQPNYNEKSKLPGPLWTLFCSLGLRLGGSVNGIIAGIILLNTAGIYLTYKLADLTVGFPSSLWAAMLCATQPWAVFYSELLYNPDVMVFLGGLLFLALWDVIRRPGSRSICWVCLLLMSMPQFHMSGLMLVPASAIILLLANVRINLAWLLVGILAGCLMYVPYLRGESAHAWQNTIGMFSGRDRHSWEGLKALSAPLSFLVSWAPRWTRSASEYRELGKACFGSFGAFLAFNFLAALVGSFLLVGAFVKTKDAMNGFWRTPREAFSRSVGVLFLFVVVAVPILFALMSGNPFHTRYCLVFLPALFSLSGYAVRTWLCIRRLGGIFGGGLILITAANVWFMLAMYHYQGNRIEHGPTLVPSFRHLESIYQRLKEDAGENQQVEVLVDKVYMRALRPEETAYRDAALIRPYVAARENEGVRAAGFPEKRVTYRLCPAEMPPADGKMVYQAEGILISRVAEKE